MSKAIKKVSKSKKALKDSELVLPKVEETVKPSQLEEAINTSKSALLDAQNRLQSHLKNKSTINQQLNQLDLLIERENGAVISLSNLISKLNSINKS
jgi:hypothetical protein